jgi:hydroxyquinol 1,2-dioxygenase
MTSLIEHLHHFAREVKLTEAEWIHGIIQFLKRTGHLCTVYVKSSLYLSDTLGLSLVVIY